MPIRRAEIWTCDKCGADIPQDDREGLSDHTIKIPRVDSHDRPWEQTEMLCFQRPPRVILCRRCLAEFLSEWADELYPPYPEELSPAPPRDPAAIGLCIAAEGDRQRDRERAKAEQHEENQP